MTPWVKSRATAFTLIEILVVIAIIAILIALLSPAVATAKNRGRMVGCINNMHQLGIAIQMYANDFNGRVPRATQDITDPIAGPYPSAPWTIHLQYRRYLPGNGTNYWQFPLHDTILLCPSDPPSEWASPITNNLPLMQEYGGSYLYNSETTAVDGVIPLAGQSQKILLCDAPPKDSLGLERTFDSSNFATRMKTATFPTARRHFGKCNALFLDWHVETIDPATVTIEQVQMN